METIRTTKGMVDITRLARTVIFTERSTEFVINVEYVLDGELVRRDAHVILKEQTVTATAIASGISDAEPTPTAG